MTFQKIFGSIFQVLSQLDRSQPNFYLKIKNFSSFSTKIRKNSWKFENFFGKMRGASNTSNKLFISEGASNMGRGLSIWMHLVISSWLLHVEPLWTNERHLHLRLNLFFYEWSVNKLSNSLYNSTFQHYEAFRYFGLREMIFSWKICKVMMKTRVQAHNFCMYFMLNH
jgi:hypothetical protein